MSNAEFATPQEYSSKSCFGTLVWRRAMRSVVWPLSLFSPLAPPSRWPLWRSNNTGHKLGTTAAGIVLSLLAPSIALSEGPLSVRGSEEIPTLEAQKVSDSGDTNSAALIQNPETVRDPRPRKSRQKGEAAAGSQRRKAEPFLPPTKSVNNSLPESEKTLQAYVDAVAAEGEGTGIQTTTPEGE